MRVILREPFPALSRVVDHLIPLVLRTNRVSFEVMARSQTALRRTSLIRYFSRRHCLSPFLWTGQGGPGQRHIVKTYRKHKGGSLFLVAPMPSCRTPSAMPTRPPSGPSSVAADREECSAGAREERLGARGTHQSLRIDGDSSSPLRDTGRRANPSPCRRGRRLAHAGTRLRTLHR